MNHHLSARRKIALELFRQYRKNAKKIHQLDYIFWECTLKCNLNCMHCGSDCKSDPAISDMPLEDFLSAIDDITPIVNPNKTMIVLTGGEPLLRKDLEKCGREFYKRGFPWGFVSNGYAFNKSRFEKFISAGLRAVTISLDGFEQSHNWLRGNKKSYSNALKTISILAKYNDIRFDVVSCVTERSIGDLEDLKELLINHGVKEWRIFTIFPTGRAKDADELQLSQGSFRSLFNFITHVREEGRIILNYGCEGFLGNYEGKVRDHLFFCRAGVSVASVLAGGSISACPNINHKYIQGNIYHDSFRDVWENRFQIMRNREWMKTGLCKDCRYFKYCEGNGLHLRNEGGELLFCHLKRLI